MIDHIEWIAIAGWASFAHAGRCRWRCLLTGCAGGVVLDGLSLLDELVLGGGETALDGRADGGRAELGGQARGGAEDLSLENHGGLRICWDRRRLGSEGRVFFKRLPIEALLVWSRGMRSGLGKLR